MDKAARGKAIEQRMRQLFVSERGLSEFAKEQGTTFDRATLKRVTSGTATEATYDKADELLNRIEALRSAAVEAGEDLEESEDEMVAGMVEIRASGNFGVDIVVRGPVGNLAALKDAAADLIRSAREDS